MKQPADLHQAPNGGWRYTDSRTGVFYQDNALEAIYSRVLKSWRANDIPVPDDWKAVIAHEICEQNERIECREIGEPERHLTMDDVLRFGKTVKNWLADGGKFVSAEESDRRAQVCRSCKENKPVSMCFGCTASLKWLSERTGWPTTRFDPELQNCRPCGCLLRLQIHMPLEVIDSKGVEYPSWCWKQPTSPQA